MRALIHLRPFSSQLQNIVIRNNVTIVRPFQLLAENTTKSKNVSLITNRKESTKSIISASEKAMLRKPTTKCDPYEQNGKPLTIDACTNLLENLDPDWKLSHRLQETILNGDEENKKCDFNTTINETRKATNSSPIILYREFNHADFINASHFLTQMSYVCMNQNHYPKSMSLNHSIDRRRRRVGTIIQLHTDLLCGLSFNDFHLATMMDIEIQRDNVKPYIQL